jgi:hypothetical protein
MGGREALWWASGELQFDQPGTCGRPTPATATVGAANRPARASHHRHPMATQLSRPPQPHWEKLVPQIPANVYGGKGLKISFAKVGTAPPPPIYTSVPRKLNNR